jgi:hypothetical protein
LKDEHENNFHVYDLGSCDKTKFELTSDEKASDSWCDFRASKLRYNYSKSFDYLAIKYRQY